MKNESRTQNATVRRRGTTVSITARRLATEFLLFYPFTAAGTILFAVSVTLFVLGAAGKNPYSVLLSFTAFVVLVAGAVLGRIQARRFAGSEPSWNPGGAVYAERMDIMQRFTLPGHGILPFFRLNILLKGPFIAGRKITFKFRREVSAVEGSEIDVPMYFPLSGVFHAKAVARVRDIFGLTSSRLGPSTQRQLIIQPPPLLDVLQEKIEATGGFEEKSRRKSSDEEKYYMREYIPGDRLRDINWKSSSRLSQLITRISPHAQEKTRVVHVVLRNYAPGDADTLESAAHLHFLKRWLIAFIRKIRMDHPEYRFHIVTGTGSVKILESDEDVELFSLDLGGLFFMRDPGGALEIPFSEGYLFTTVFDTHLARFLTAHDGTRFHVFRTGFPGTEDREERAEIRLLPLSGVVPIPDTRSAATMFTRTRPAPGGLPRVALSETALRVRIL